MYQAQYQGANCFIGFSGNCYFISLHTVLKQAFRENGSVTAVLYSDTDTTPVTSSSSYIYQTVHNVHVSDPYLLLRS